jgi:exosortase
MKHPSYLGPAKGFAILAAVSLLFWWRPLGNTFGLALANEAYTHILLILPLSAALIYLDSKALRIDSQPSPRIGAALLALALLMGCYARWGRMGATPDDVRLSLAMFGVVTWWIASAVFCFGLRAFRSLLLPLCFLFLLVPVPGVVLSVIVGWLQHGSAWMAALLFRVVGEPVQRDGVWLSLPKLDIEVAKECSSIRSSFLLVITTIVLAHLFLRSWWRNLILVLIAIPLSIAKNGLRIFVIAELGTHVDPGFLDGRLHHHGGIVFLFIALGAIVVLLAILHRGETRPQLLSASTGPK